MRKRSSGGDSSLNAGRRYTEPHRRCDYAVGDASGKLLRPLRDGLWRASNRLGGGRWRAAQEVECVSFLHGPSIVSMLERRLQECWEWLM